MNRIAFDTAFQVELDRAPHQLLDERGAYSLCDVCRVFDDVFRNRGGAGVKPNQLASPGSIRQREFNRLVDATWSRC